VRSWRGERVLVTGATGLLGPWLIKELLDRGAQVVALVPDPDPRSEFYRGGASRRVAVVLGVLEDQAAIQRAINLHEVSTVFHLGAQTIVGVAHRAPAATLDTNIRGTWNILEACRQLSPLVKRIVVASSDKAYGESPTLPYTEEMPLGGKHPYEVSKSCTDLISQMYHHTYGLPVTITRCGNIYGGGDLNWSRIVPDTIRHCLAGKRMIIRSDGTFLRDYIYVRDVALAYLCLAEAMDDPQVHGKGYNFSYEKPQSVLEIVESIRTLMDRRDLEPDIQNTARGEIRNQYLSAAKAKAELGWRPQYEGEAGMRETIEWYRAFLAEDQGQSR
jgi:CDP-glucose 4,6-dehydratase